MVGVCIFISIGTTKFYEKLNITYNVILVRFAEGDHILSEQLKTEKLQSEGIIKTNLKLKSKMIKVLKDHIGIS